MKRGIHLPTKLKRLFTKRLETKCIFEGRGHTICIAKAISRIFNYHRMSESECMSLTTALKLPGYLDERLQTLYRYLHNHCHVKISVELYLTYFKESIEEYNTYCTEERDTGRMDCFYYGKWCDMTVVINGTSTRKIAEVLSIKDSVFADSFKCVTMGNLPVTFDILNRSLKYPYVPFQIVDRDTGHMIDLTIPKDLVTKYFQTVVLKV